MIAAGSDSEAILSPHSSQSSPEGLPGLTASYIPKTVTKMARQRIVNALQGHWEVGSAPDPKYEVRVFGCWHCCALLSMKGFDMSHSKAEIDNLLQGALHAAFVKYDNCSTSPPVRHHISFDLKPTLNSQSLAELFATECEASQCCFRSPSGYSAISNKSWSGASAEGR